MDLKPRNSSSRLSLKDFKLKVSDSFRNKSKKKSKSQQNKRKQKGDRGNDKSVAPSEEIIQLKTDSDALENIDINNKAVDSVEIKGVTEITVKLNDTRLSFDENRSGNNLPIQKSEIKRESLCISNLNQESDANGAHSFDKDFENLTEIYVNNSEPRGLLFMQNIEIFDENVGPERKGSNKDYENLLSLFNTMKYECNEQNGNCKSGRITAKEFHANLQRFCNLDKHKHVDSCLIVIMSHGCGDKKFLSSDGKEIRVKEICQALNNVHCKHLTNKPKILIFQFCRTSNFNIEENRELESNIGYTIENMNKRKLSTLSFISYGGSLSSVGQANNSGRAISMISTNSSVFSEPSFETSPNDHCKYSSSSDNQAIENNHEKHQTNEKEYDLDSSSILQKTNKLQINSDFFLVFSTVGGEVSYRDPKSGAVLIKAMCHIFKEYAHKDDIEELFRKVSIYLRDFGVHNETETLCLQTCERTNIGFDKKFYFNCSQLKENGP
ncbi:UNVERIFIED_CONTAM: hypothetical protein RMT77_009130 [Armadillidium vulgare]